jgi:hypothetical protein
VPSDNANLGAAVGLSAVVIASLFRAPWVLAVHLALFAMRALRWLIIVGLVTAVSNLPQTHAVLGWTPFSLLLGDDIYARGDSRSRSSPQPARHRRSTSK